MIKVKNVVTFKCVFVIVLIARFTSSAMLPLRLTNGNYQTQITSKGATMVVTCDTGSSNLAIPASTCMLCYGGTASQCPNTQSQCMQGNYSEFCGCEQSVNLNNLNANEAVSCDSNEIDWAVCSLKSFNVAVTPWNASTNLPSCECVAGGEIAPGVASLASLQVVASSTGYGSCSGYTGVVVKIPVSFGEQTTHIYATLMSFMADQFACAPVLSGPQTNGIMGLAYKNLNTIGVQTPFESMVASKQVANEFTICANTFNDLAGFEFGQGGVMVFGDIADEAPWLRESDAIEWTQITSESFYNVHIHDILLNDVSVTKYPPPNTIINNRTLNSFGAPIIDSGTTMLMLPEPAFKAISPWLPQYVDAKTLPTLPSITVVLGVTTCVTVTGEYAGTFCGSDGILTGYVSTIVNGSPLGIAQFQLTPNGNDTSSWQLQNPGGEMIANSEKESASTDFTLEGAMQFQTFNVSEMEPVTITLNFVTAPTQAYKPIKVELQPSELYMCCGPDYPTKDTQACSNGNVFFENICQLAVSASVGMRAVLGHPIFWPKTVTFDVENKRIGFANKGSCTSAKPNESPIVASPTPQPVQIPVDDSTELKEENTDLIVAIALVSVVLVFMVLLCCVRSAYIKSNSKSYGSLNNRLIAQDNQGEGSVSGGTEYVEMGNLP